LHTTGNITNILSLLPCGYVLTFDVK